MSSRLDRRELLKLGGMALTGTAAASILAACGGPAAPPSAAAPVSAAPPSAAASKPAAAASSAAPKPAASAASSAQSSASGQKIVKAAFVYLGTANDKGWTNAHDDGRKYLEQQLKGQVETTFAENVPEAAESQRVFEDFAQKGYNVVYGTSFGYMDFMLAAAQKYPDVKFEHNTGFKTASNLSTYGAAQEDARYVAGIISGKMTKSNVMGFIGSFPIPEVIRDMNGWARGVQSVNPQAKIRMVWINSWFDPPKETTAANSLLDLNADVLASVTDSPAMAQAAAAKKRYSVGSDSDQTSYAPDYMLICPFWVWGIHYVKSVQSILSGAWKNNQVYYHMKDGVSSITDPNAKVVPADVAKLATDAIAGLKAGTLDIWKGPLKDNKGNVIVPDGKSIGDAFKGTPLPGQTAADGYVQSEQMNWALDNVIGDIPKS
ncbi:MAG TPA: BMP family ABC transporter substrate-binding protein [Chloroflexota bacterium]|nr:BMP family ABC transporter substrate-binding protein [Chloroflexota bacterium]